MSSGGGKRRNLELPIDVVECVLVRLPVEDILRCKLLSKTYYDLIESPSFINNHYRWRATNHANLIKGLHKRARPANSLIKPARPVIVSLLSIAGGSGELIPPVGKGVCAELVGSCNGLLCLTIIPSASAMVWNPATRDYIRLPEYKCRHALDISHPGDALGFGYDSKSDDYKLLRIGDYSGENYPSFFVEVCSMRTNCWSKIGFVLPDLVSSKDYRFYPTGLFMRGKLYWVVVSKDTRRGEALIVSYDMSENTFHKIETPDDVMARKGGFSLDITDFMGHLSLLVAKSPPLGTTDSDQTLFDIWVMEDHSKYSWSKRYTIGPFSGPVNPTRASINGKFVFEFRYDDHSDYILYDPNHTKEEQIPIRVDDRYYSPWNYTESLVPITKPGQGARTRIKKNVASLNLGK